MVQKHSRWLGGGTLQSTNVCRRGIVAALVSCALFLGGCNACEPTPDGEPVPDTDPPALDVALGDDEVRCGRVTKESELIGGPAAYAQVGHAFRCYNSKIRFIVSDGDEPIGSSAQGGTLIDVDLVRDDENEAGNDVFRELIYATGIQEISVESITVVDDGSSGEQAILRVEGHPAPLSVAPQVAFLAQQLPALVRHEFILTPASSVIEIRTTIINESDDQLYSILFGDAVAFGGANHAHNPVSGLLEASPGTTTPWIAFGMKTNTSYAYWCSDRDVSLPFDSFGVKVALCADDLIVVRDLSYSRFFAVGDGTLDSVARLAIAGRGLAAGEVSGTVTRGGVPAPSGVLVFALDGSDPATAVVVNQTKVGDNGEYSMALVPGDYYMLSTIEVGMRSASSAVSVGADTSATIDMTIAAAGTIAVTTTFTDADGAALVERPAKITLVAEGGSALPLVSLGETTRGAIWGAFPTVAGALEIALPPGSYRVYVTRGFTFSRFEELVQVEAGARVDVAAAITRVLDTSTFVATEFHQHTLGSLDASVSPRTRVLENAAEGIGFAASTDHDNVVDFQPIVDELGLKDWLVVIPGDEVSYQSIGHFNVYPWEIDPEAPLKDLGVKMWWQKTIPEMFAFVRERAGDPIIQVNHPRGGTAGFFSSMRLNPSDATRVPRDPTTLATLPVNIYSEWSSNFEAVEVDGDIGALTQYLPAFDAEMATMAERSPGDVPAFADYLALLGAGLNVAAMGNSDSHHFNQGIGYPRSFVRLGSDSLDTATAQSVRSAIRNQLVTIANGCLITLHTPEGTPMGSSEAIDSTDSIRIKVQAPLHADVDTVEVFINGRVQFLSVDANGIAIVDANAGELRAPVSVRDQVIRVDVPLAGVPSGDNDLVIIATAHGAGGLAPTSGGRVYCISAPLYVDRGEDGFVGWFDATQTIR